MQRQKRRGKKVKRNGERRLTQDKLMAILQKEGREKIMVVASTYRFKIPKPVHSQMRTRQYVLAPNIGSGFTSGGSTQGSYIAQATDSTLVFGSMAFSLQDLDQVTTFTALFDQYRIDRVIVQIKSRNPTANFNTSSVANATPPSTYWVIDRDDSTTPTTLAAMRQYDNCQEAQYNDHVEIDLQPSVTPAIYAAGAFSGYAVCRTGVWLDVANVSIPHYGVKFGITELSATASSTYYWDLEFIYYVSFRNVR